ncbi:MAG: 2-C-methyl-D-erythritol 4-phosphate cytidylyltransferase, partial [Actinomycetota bacterium]|nr:2-C-methyl-D-erythritol 4-phosphate cytidylyltransferase [Actinomycetota bacterium]
VPPELVRRVAAAVRQGAAAVVPVLPLADTVKEVADHVVVATVDRVRLRAAQTPQGFARRVLARAHATVRQDATDDAALVEALGVQVVAVHGAPEAFKITHTFDLAVAAALLAQR